VLKKRKKILRGTRYRASAGAWRQYEARQRWPELSEEKENGIMKKVSRGKRDRMVVTLD